MPDDLGQDNDAAAAAAVALKALMNNTLWWAEWQMGFDAAPATGS